MNAMKSPSDLFRAVVDRTSLYDVSWRILELSDDSLTEKQKDFKHCYDLWLGLSNGFYDVCYGTALRSLPRGISAFEKLGVTLIAIAGRRVLAEYEKLPHPPNMEEIAEFAFHDEEEAEIFFRAIKEIDEELGNRIMDDGFEIERKLIALAAEC